MLFDCQVFFYIQTIVINDVLIANLFTKVERPFFSYTIEAIEYLKDV